MITLTTARLDDDEIGQLEAICRSQVEYWRISGDQDPDTMTQESIAAMLREDAAADGCETVVARDSDGRVVGFAQLLLRHPVDGCPWIGLLLVDGRRGRRQGYGRAIVAAIEERLTGVSAIRLGVLVANEAAKPFWHALGYRRIDLRLDRAKGRPTIVMEKTLRGPTLGS